MKTRVLEADTYMTQPYHKNGAKGYDYDHYGVDLVGFNGTRTILSWVLAHSSGRVVEVRGDCTGFEYNSYGNYVKLLHDDGSFSLYAHLAYGTVQVTYGQIVKQGQRLGYMGNTGTSYGGHLHFELRRPDGYQYDPEPFLNSEIPVYSRWVENISGGWYCVKNGAIEYSYNGIAPNENGWWKISGGKVDFSYTGLANNENGWFYCKDGKVDFSKNSICHNSNGWWKVTNGKVDFSYNGLANNENGWFMLQSGKVDFDYNGLCVNEFGTWVIEKGKVNFDYNGNYNFSGKTYSIKNGKVV